MTTNLQNFNKIAISMIMGPCDHSTICFYFDPNAISSSRNVLYTNRNCMADGDLNNLLKRADSSPQQIRKLLQEIKGIGNVGTDIFFDTAQGIWPCIAPFIDPRSLKTADQLGFGNDVNSIWRNLGQDPIEMCKLSSALTTVRLEKKEKEFQ